MTDRKERRDALVKRAQKFVASGGGPVGVFEFRLRSADWDQFIWVPSFLRPRDGYHLIAKVQSDGTVVRLRGW